MYARSRASRDALFVIKLLEGASLREKLDAEHLWIKKGFDYATQLPRPSPRHTTRASCTATSSRITSSSRRTIGSRFWISAWRAAATADPEGTGTDGTVTSAGVVGTMASSRPSRRAARLPIVAPTCLH